jgi:LPS export ABC transporter protein LptC
MDLRLKRWLPWCLIGAIALGGCAKRNQNTDKSQDNQENRLTISDFSLEQSSNQGQLWWRLKAKQATYTIDKKIAKVSDLAGELYQDGQVVMRLTAKTADVEQDGERVILRGDVTASETRNQLVVNSQELEWQASKDLLSIRKNISASNPQARATGQRGEYTSRQRRLEMFDQTVTIVPAENLRLTTNYLLWEVDSKTISSNKTTLAERFRDNKLIEKLTAERVAYNLDRRVADFSGQLRFNSLAQSMQVTANSGTWDVPKESIVLRDNIRFTGSEPPLQISANLARWNIPQQTITASNALEIFYVKEQANFKANQGNIDLKNNVATLSGNAQGTSTKNQANLRADNITWAIDSQQIVGRGGVRYQQTDPKLLLTGTEGVGKLQDQNVVVTGTKNQLVETEIVPPPASP